MCILPLSITKWNPNQSHWKLERKKKPIIPIKHVACPLKPNTIYDYITKPQIFVTWEIRTIYIICTHHHTFYNKTMLLLSTSNLIPSMSDEATPSWWSSKSMSHKNPYPSSHLGLIWVTLLQLLFVSLENWRRFIKELFWFSFRWQWWVVIEDEKEANWLYPIGMVWLVRDGAIVSYISCGLNLALFSVLPLWNTLHKTQSSCNQQKFELISKNKCETKITRFLKKL